MRLAEDDDEDDTGEAEHNQTNPSHHPAAQPGYANALLLHCFLSSSELHP